VIAVQADAGAAAVAPARAAGDVKADAPKQPGDPKDPKEKRDLKAEAMSSSTVQAMLDVFPAEIRDVEEM